MKHFPTILSWKTWLKSPPPSAQGYENENGEKTSKWRGITPADTNFNELNLREHDKSRANRSSIPWPPANTRSLPLPSLDATIILGNVEGALEHNWRKISQLSNHERILGIYVEPRTHISRMQINYTRHFELNEPVKTWIQSLFDPTLVKTTRN